MLSEVPPATLDNIAALVRAHPSFSPDRRCELARLQRLAVATPDDAQIHGMYVVELVALMKSRTVAGPITERVHRFRYYPLRKFMSLLLEAASTLYPKESVSDGLRSLGRLVIPTFFQSIAGRVLRDIAGRNWEQVLKCLSRGYQLSLRPGSAHFAQLKPGRARVQLRQVWNFGESYQVGVMEGAMAACGVRGRISARQLSDCDTDIVLEWNERYLH